MAAVHRVRERLIAQRTQTINMLRGQMAEFGVVAAKGPQHVKGLVAELVEPESVPEPLRQVLLGLVRLLTALREQIAVLDKQILAWHRANPCSRRLSGIDGFGPILSSALALRVQEPQRFACGRDLSAWIGLAPKQNSSGGKIRLGAISKKGDVYLRRLLINGAQAVRRSRRTPRSRAAGAEGGAGGMPGARAGAGSPGLCRPRPVPRVHLLQSHYRQAGDRRSIGHAAGPSPGGGARLYRCGRGRDARTPGRDGASDGTAAAGERNPMLSEVLDHFGFARDFYGAGYHETPYHRQVLQNLRGAIHAGRLIAFTGLVGSGKTLLLRQLRDILVAEKRVTVSKSLAVDKAIRKRRDWSIG